MAILTTTVQAISAAELARANALEVTAARVPALEAEVARLNALLAALSAKPRLYVDGGQFKTRSGSVIRLQVQELMYQGDVARIDPLTLVRRIKALGFNGISPLFGIWRNADGSLIEDFGTLARVKALGDAALAENMVFAPNGDHRGGLTQGRAWLNDPAMVAYLNAQPHVYLVLEAETDPPQPTNAQWVTSVKNMVDALRGAGHKSIIRVGCPEGGRHIKYPIQAGAEVLANDPEHQIAFGGQLYWPSSTAGNQWYQNFNGFAPGLAGTRAAIAAAAATGRAFMVGVDWRDNIGLTGWQGLVDECAARGVSFGDWVLTGDGNLPENNTIDRFDWEVEAVTPIGLQKQAKLLAVAPPAVVLA